MLEHGQPNGVVRPHEVLRVVPSTPRHLVVCARRCPTPLPALQSLVHPRAWQKEDLNVVRQSEVAVKVNLRELWVVAYLLPKFLP